MIFHGLTITIHLQEHTGELDEGGDPVTRYSPHTVDNVLIAPATTGDIEASTREMGAETTITVMLPKTFTGQLDTQTLQGAHLTYQKQKYEIIGNPTPYPPQFTPGNWNLIMKAKLVKG